MLPSLLCSCSVAERVSELSFASAQASDSNKQFPPRRSASNEASCEFPWETCTLVECGLQRLSMQDTREYKERFLLEPSRRMSCSRGIASLCVDGTSMIEIVDSAMHFQPCASSSLFNTVLRAVVGEGLHSLRSLTARWRTSSVACR